LLQQGTLAFLSCHLDLQSSQDTRKALFVYHIIRTLKKPWDSVEGG